MTNTIKALLIILVCALLGVLVIAPLLESLMFPTTGTITYNSYLESYVDNQVWTNGSAIDWGNVSLNTAYYCNLTVENTSGVNITIYVTANPPSYLTMDWTGNNTLLMPAQVVVGNLTLTVAATVPVPSGTAFDFLINLQADGGV